MAQEIYHRSEWGNPTETWGNVYLNADLTNELYKRASEYENSWVTDQLLNGVGIKPSIILTPTAYEDGVLNSVKPKGGENLLLQSNQFDTTWTISADLNLTSGQSGYDNTNDAWLLKKAAVGKKSCQQFLSLSSSKYTYSAYFKAESTNWVQLWAYNGSVSSNAFFDLENGVVGTTSGSNLNNATIKSVGNGWYRCAITYTSETTILRIYPAYSDNNTIDGADSGIYIQDAQLERGAEANTYIETTTTAKANGDFDFTRGSSATRVNELGLVEDVQILSGELVQNGDFEQSSDNVLVGNNSTFDSGVGDWVSYGAGTLIHNTNKLEVSVTASEGGAMIPTNSLFTGGQSGKLIKVRVQLWLGTMTNTNFKVFIGGVQENVTLSSTPTYYDFYLKPTSSSNLIIYKGNIVGSSGTFFIDNVSVKEVGQNWTFFGEAEFTNNGARIYSSDGSNSYIGQLSILTNTKKYRLSYEITDSTTGSLKLINVNGQSSIVIPSTVGIHTLDFIANNANFYILRNSGITDVTIDNISVVEVTDDTDLPRINYIDGEGSLLLEPQSTNLITKSVNWDNWAEVRTTLSFEQETSPSGNQDASLLVDSTDNNTHISQAIYYTSSGTSDVTWSLFAKKQNNRYISLRLQDDAANSSGNSNNIVANYDLESGVVTDTLEVGTPTNAYADIQQYGNGWYRLIISMQKKSGITRTDLQIRLCKDGVAKSSEPFTGTGNDGNYFYGLQLEELSYATSYIPTNGSIETRLADVCNNSGNSDLINSTEGVLYAEISALANDGTNRTIALNKDSNDRIQMYFDTADNSLSIFYKAQGTHTFGMNETLTDATEFNKIAFKWKTNDFALWVNGIETDTVSSGVTSNADTLNALEFEMFNNFASFYGNVKCVAVFKEALSDTELEKLTTI